MNYVITSVEKTILKEGKEKPFSNVPEIFDELIVERIIKIYKNNGARQIFWIIDENKKKLHSILSIDRADLNIEVITKNKMLNIKELIGSIQYIQEQPFCISILNSIFNENEFTEFLDYSLLQDDIDGVIGITRDINVENPLCVAMNDNDIITKFSDSKEGYNWKTGGVYFFTPKVLAEIQSAFKLGSLTINDFLRSLIKEGYVLKGYAFSKIITYPKMALSG